MAWTKTWRFSSPRIALLTGGWASSHVLLSPLSRGHEARAWLHASLHVRPGAAACSAFLLCAGAVQDGASSTRNLTPGHPAARAGQPRFTSAMPHSKVPRPRAPRCELSRHRCRLPAPPGAWWWRSLIWEGVNGGRRVLGQCEQPAPQPRLTHGWPSSSEPCWKPGQLGQTVPGKLAPKTEPCSKNRNPRAGRSAADPPQEDSRQHLQGTGTLEGTGTGLTRRQLRDVSRTPSPPRRRRKRLTPWRNHAESICDSEDSCSP